MSERMEKENLEINTVPFSDIVLLDQQPVSSGAFGEVYRAYHRLWSRQIAYKRLGLQFLDKDKVIRRLKREAAIHRQLRHVNIVSMFGFVFEHGNYGILLEYVTYGSLDYFLENNRRMNSGRPQSINWRLKVKIAHDVCRGMSYLHNLPSPVIHADLKTDNVLIGEQLTAKISDFGLAAWKVQSLSSSHAAMKGTASHVPPEKWRSPQLRPDEKFDVYGFAILFWETLAEEKPFSKDSEALIKGRVCDGERPPFENVPGCVPKEVKVCIANCWDYRPENRPAFKVLVSTLSQFLNGHDEQLLLDISDLLTVYNSRPAKKEDSSETEPEHMWKLKRARQQLCERMRRTDQILIYLLQRNAIKEEEFSKIRSERELFQRIRLLVDALVSKPIYSYQVFLLALNETNQQHICLLVETGPEAVICENHRYILIREYQYLRENISISLLPAHLFSSGVLDQQELEEINTTPGNFDKISNLVNLMLRSSFQQYELFLQALLKSNNECVCEKLEGHAANSRASPAKELQLRTSQAEKYYTKKTKAAAAAVPRTLAPAMASPSVVKTTLAAAVSRAGAAIIAPDALPMQSKCTEALEQVDNVLHNVKKMHTTASARLVESRVFRIASTSAVSGVTELFGRIYITYDGSDAIQTFDGSSFKHLPDLAIIKNMHAGDLASNARCKIVFVYDFNNDGVIWRVMVNDKQSKRVTRWLSTGEQNYRGTMSATEDWLLLVSSSPAVVDIYNIESAKLQKTIKLPPVILNPLHIITSPGSRSSNPSFFVTHGLTSGTLHQICEINYSGQILRACGGKRGSGDGLFNTPNHIAVDAGSGRVYVADHGSNRVIVVDVGECGAGKDSEWQSMWEGYRVMLDKDRDDLKSPSRLFCSSATGRLLVGQTADHLDVYETRLSGGAARVDIKLL